MNANDAARFAPGRPGFPAKAWCVSDELFRKIDNRQNFFAMKIRHWNFRRRCEKKLILLEAIHVGFQLRQLCCADHAIPPNQKRRTHLNVTMLARMQIKHEIDERAFELRARTSETNKTAAA